MQIENNWGRIRAIELRYVLTTYLLEAGGPLTVAELARLLVADGFEVDGRASKTISDALRWERRRGRVIRVGRGRYAPGHVPRQTASRIRRRVRTMQERIVATTWPD